jgi:hypothetical protein
MSNSLIITLIIFSIVLFIITTIVLRKGRIPIKYALVWYFSSISLFIVALFPFILEWVASFLGFKTVSNLVVGIIISLLLFITMSLTIIVSGQKKKITLLIQEVSILKSEKEVMKK